MSRPSTADLTKLTDSDITEKIDGIRRELFDLRFQKATSQLTNTHRFKEARIKLAQLLTVQNQRTRANSSS